jgi:hypothetical protein
LKSKKKKPVRKTKKKRAAKEGPWKFEGTYRVGHEKKPTKGNQ